MKRVIFLVALLAAGCQGMTLTDEGNATLTLSISKEDVSTKAFVHNMPDTNLMTLVVRKGSDTLFRGRYNQRPSKLTVPAGEYTIEFFNYRLKEPVLGIPCWGDSKLIMLEKDKTTPITLKLKQLSGGVKLIFTQSFKEKYKLFKACVYNEAGAVDFFFTEQNYTYLKPGRFYVKLKWATDPTDHFPIFTSTINAAEMLTYSVGLSPIDSATVGGGITIDTLSTWKTDTVYIDKVDGRTPENAVNLSRWDEFITIPCWFNAYIVGTNVSKDSVQFTPPFDKNSHIAIASDPNERRREMIFGANLVSVFQPLYGLGNAPEMLGRKIKIKGTFTRSYLGGPGLGATFDIKPQ